MNSIFRNLSKLGATESDGTRLKEKSLKRKRPFTTAWKKIDAPSTINEWWPELIGTADGVKTLADFPDADFINIHHANNRTTGMSR